ACEQWWTSNPSPVRSSEFGARNLDGCVAAESGESFVCRNQERFQMTTIRWAAFALLTVGLLWTCGPASAQSPGNPLPIGAPPRPGSSVTMVENGPALP